MWYNITVKYQAYIYFANPWVFKGLPRLKLARSVKAYAPESSLFPLVPLLGGFRRAGDLSKARLCRSCLLFDSHLQCFPAV